MTRRNRPLIYTACNSGAMFVLGMVSAQKGPSFNDLILISNTDVEGGSFFVMASNFGFMMGSLLAGALYGRIKTKSMTIAIALTCSGLSTSLVPQSTILPAMIFMQAFVSVSSSVYETTLNAEEIQAWGGSSESAMQFLSFCLSIGGVISPLITRPFMAPKVTHANGGNGSPLATPANMIASMPIERVVLPYIDSLKMNTSSSVLCTRMSSNCTDSLGNKLIHNLSTYAHLPNQTLESDDVTSNLQYAYSITGVASIFMSIPFYFLCVQSITKKLPETRKEKGPLTTIRKVPRTTYVRLLALVSAFYFFYAMGTDSFGQYLFFFLVTHLDWSKENGAYLMSMFWALGIPMKLLLIVILKRVKVGTVLLLSILGIVVFIILFTLASQFHIHVLAWISCSGLAISEASISVGGFSWTDGNLIPLDGKGTSVLIAFGCLGALCAPPLLGFLMKNWSLMSFPYCVLIQVSTSATIFLIMLYVVKPAMDRTYGPLRPPIEHIVSEGDNSEGMVSNEDGNRTGKKTLETTEIM